MLSRHAERFVRGASAAIVASSAACSAEHAFQGKGYDPEGTTTVADATLRPEAGLPACDGGACADAGTDALAPPDVGAGAPPSNTCGAARDIGTVSGDTITPSLQTTGTCSEWLELRAMESDEGVFGVAMKLRISVVSDANADLYVYLDAKTDRLSCDVPFATSNGVGPGEREITSVSWGESLVGNGADDSRTVSVLVLFPDAVCSASTAWSLVVDGDR